MFHIFLLYIAFSTFDQFTHWMGLNPWPWRCVRHALRCERSIGKCVLYLWTVCFTSWGPLWSRWRWLLSARGSWRVSERTDSSQESLHHCRPETQNIPSFLSYRRENRGFSLHSKHFLMHQNTAWWNEDCKGSFKYKLHFTTDYTLYDCVCDE